MEEKTNNVLEGKVIEQGSDKNSDSVWFES